MLRRPIRQDLAISFQCMNIKKAVVGNNYGFSVLSFQSYRIIKGFDACIDKGA